VFRTVGSGMLMPGQVPSMQIDEEQSDTANEDARRTEVVTSLTTAIHVYIAYEMKSVVRNVRDKRSEREGEKIYSEICIIFFLSSNLERNRFTKSSKAIYILAMTCLSGHLGAWMLLR